MPPNFSPSQTAAGRTTSRRSPHLLDYVSRCSGVTGQGTAGSGLSTENFRGTFQPAFQLRSQGPRPKHGWKEALWGFEGPRWTWSGTNRTLQRPKAPPPHPGHNCPIFLWGRVKKGDQLRLRGNSHSPDAWGRGIRFN